jgi:hypothetical protein
MSFWVIFDTSQLADYYADVHNLIALPSHATIRYDYHRNYLSQDAIQSAEKPTIADALLLYEQKNVPYERTPTDTRPANLDAACIRSATRLAKILNIVSEGDRYYFDIQVTTYPAQTAADLNEIIKGLGDSHPWFTEKDGFAAGKFVCISHADAAYQRLSLGDQSKNWQSVVNSLTRGAMQFSGDVFWRLNGPYKGAGRALQAPKILKHLESGVVRRVDAVYTIPRGTTWRFELTSDVGRQVAGRPQYETEVTSSNDTAIRMVGTSHFPLRRYSTRMVQFRAESADKFGRGSAALFFTTLPKQTAWPNGPAFTLDFNTRENRIRLWLGVLLAIIGTIALIAGKSDFMKCYEELGLILAVCGALLDMLACALLLRKLSLSGA